WATLSEAEQKAIYKDYGELSKTPGVTPGLTLGLPKDATTVQVKDGKAVTREGAYLSEGAGGYLVFEADDLDVAIDLASRIPAARC
ncbi:MAG: YciI family protein, partial [Bryobacteraceae bacterium]